MSEKSSQPAKLHPLSPEGKPLATTAPWEIVRFLLLTHFRIFHRLRIRGLRHVPSEGPMLLAPNHVSYYDPPLVGAAFPYLVHSMAWDALFQFPLFGRAIRSFGAFPVKLNTADKGAIAQSLRVLRGGACLTIFPEGGRSETGELAEYEPGAARLALQTGATVIPVTITGGFDIWPRTNKLPRLFRPITIKYHAPIPVTPVHGREALQEALPTLIAAMRRPVERRLRAYERLKARKSRRQ